MGIAIKLSFGSILSVVILIFAVTYYRQTTEEELQARLQKILDGLLRAEKRVVVQKQPNIAIGFGSCQDLIIQSSEIFNRLPPPKEPVHRDVITNQQELLEAFAYFFRHGAAAERFVSNATLFREILELAKLAPSTRYHIGGNAPIMARRFALEGTNDNFFINIGAQVLLGAHMSKKLRDELPPGVTVSGPVIPEDDVHLLLEYPAGEEWGDYVSPRANRFIIHNDHQNPKLSSADSFLERLPHVSPDILVLGGMQMMDNFPFSEGERAAVIKKVEEMLISIPDEVPIHFEMASYVDLSLLQQLVHHILPYADSLGMNEQELPNLYSLLKYGNVSLVSNSYPRVAAILDEMRDVYRILHENFDPQGGRRPVSRIHIHTLAFQAIMTTIEAPKKGGVKFASWKNSQSSAAKAALTAHRHTCGSHDIDVARAKVIMDDSFTTSRAGGRRIPFNDKHPVNCWREEVMPGHKVEICVAPVLVCTKVLQTGGGGDNVSAAGLVLQV